MFKIGSCRLNYLKDLDKHNQLYFTHTTNEVIQLLNFLDGKKNDGIYINAFPDNFTEKIANMVEKINSCKYFLIEISSIKKLVDSNGIHYPSVELGRQYKNHKLKCVLKSKVEIINDLYEIVRLIFKYKNIKKVIIQGHYDFGINNRKIIDDAIIEFKKNIIITMLK